MMELADRGLHWQRAAIERERLFDQIDTYLAWRRPARPEGPAREYERCPDCHNLTMRRHYRYGPGGVDYCPRCGWEEPAD